MTIENEGLEEAELFNQAVTDEPEVIPEPQAEVEQARDADGKFAKADEPAEVVAETEAEKPAVDDNAPQVPSWRVREINEERRSAIAERDALRAEQAQWRTQQQKQPEPEKAAKPDPLLDPDGYEKYIEAKLEDKFLNDRRENSLQSAHKTYKTEFEEAYSAAQKQVDPALRARMQQSRDPGETLIEWHREQKAKAEVGTDLNAYKAKLRDEALKDPEFRKAAMEAWRNESQPQSNGRPRVELPPSLNGASRSNAALRSANDDVSDAELFDQTVG